MYIHTSASLGLGAATYRARQGVVVVRLLAVRLKANLKLGRVVLKDHYELALRHADKSYRWLLRGIENPGDLRRCLEHSLSEDLKAAQHFSKAKDLRQRLAVICDLAMESCHRNEDDTKQILNRLQSSY
jgi:hypothetical protein